MGGMSSTMEANDPFGRQQFVTNGTEPFFNKLCIVDQKNHDNKISCAPTRIGSVPVSTMTHLVI
jgi:hypothetical protein